MAPAASTSSRVNIARLVFFISITILTAYIYRDAKFEISSYTAFRSSRRVLSSISSVAYGESTSTSSVVFKTSTVTASVEIPTSQSDTMTGVARIPVWNMAAA